MATVAVYPGSFDPITLGHVDIIRRASKLFDELHVLVVHNPDKLASATAEFRLELIRNSLTDEGVDSSNIKLSELQSGLLSKYCQNLGAGVLIKGFRNNVDLDYELPMAQVNRDLTGIETVFIAADPRFALVSSSLVRQVAKLGGDVDRYVSDSVAKALRKE